MTATRERSAAVPAIREIRVPTSKAEILVRMHAGRNASATHETAPSIRTNRSRAISN
jgi:hypothetical protein